MNKYENASEILNLRRDKFQLHFYSESDSAKYSWRKILIVPNGIIKKINIQN